MKFLISIHGIKNSPEAKFIIKIINKVDPQKMIDGFEINGDFKDPKENFFMEEFANLMKKDSRIIQFHSPWNFSTKYMDKDYLEESLKFYNKISVILNREISIVIHPVDFPDKTIAEILTSKLLKSLNKIVASNNYKIKFTLENLNTSKNSGRLSTKNVKYVLTEFNNIGFCWDIGHEVAEKICDYSLESKLVKLLSNVHIHDVFSEDHYPFYYGKTDYKKSLEYLYSINYTGTIVTEINLDTLQSPSIKEKYKEYAENISFIKRYYLDNIKENGFLII